MTGGRNPINRWWGLVRKINPDDPDQCWPWRGGTTKKGYGTFRVRAEDGVRWTTASAHRWGFINLVRLLEPGEVVMHTCDNPSCCRPSHWKAGTYGDNSRDCVAKGRKNAAAGERNRHAKLTEDQVREIRATYEAGGISLKNLGARYGVSEVSVHGIVHRKSWRHVS